MRAKGITGRVLVHYIVDAQGDCTVLSATGGPDPSLDAAAAAAVRRWKFSPGIYHGKAVATSMMVPINFELMPTEPTNGQPPIPLVQKQPVYPLERSLKGVGAVVRVTFIVDVHGNCIVKGVAGASDPLFAAAAVEAVRQWKFEPGMADGHPVNTQLVVPIVFASERNPKAKRAHKSDTLSSHSPKDSEN